MVLAISWRTCFSMLLATALFMVCIKICCSLSCLCLSLCSDCCISSLTLWSKISLRKSHNEKILPISLLLFFFEYRSLFSRAGHLWTKIPNLYHTNCDHSTHNVEQASAKKMIPTISIFFCTVKSFNYMGANFLGFLDFCLFERMYFVDALVFSVSRKT